MYLKLIDMTYPWTEQQVRDANVLVSHPRPMPSTVPGYVRVEWASPPAYDEITGTLTEGAPIQVDGVWTQNWVVDVTDPVVAEARLSFLKAEKNVQINQWRATANQSSFNYVGKQISCDALSRSDIDGVAGSIALTGTFPAGFPGAWKAMDNTYISIPDVQAFKDLYASMTMQGTENFIHAQGLKDQLASATTKAAIDSIVW